MKMILMNGIMVMTANDLDFPVWAIKRRYTDKESPVNKHGHPGEDHAIWYWWRLDCGWNRYERITWDAIMNRLEFHHGAVFNSNSYNYDHNYKVLWERLSDNTWRVLSERYGNRVVLGTLTKLYKIERPESTYRWYRE